MEFLDSIIGVSLRIAAIIIIPFATLFVVMLIMRYELPLREFILNRLRNRESGKRD